jgi:prophage regulatory protein
MKLITFQDAAARLDLSQSTLRRMIARGGFVAAVQLAPRRVAFVESEVDDWLARRPRGPLPRPATRKQDVPGGLVHACSTAREK